MKSYPAVSPSAPEGERVHSPAVPTDPADMGIENLGCYLCGAVFIRKATRDYIRRAGSVYCANCHVWSESKPPGPLPDDSRISAA